jgi:hypothetical protein
MPWRASARRAAHNGRITQRPSSKNASSKNERPLPRFMCETKSENELDIQAAFWIWRSNQNKTATTYLIEVAT